MGEVKAQSLFTDCSTNLTNGYACMINQSGNYQLPSNGIYYVNVTPNGVFYIGASNVFLDGNGSILIGNDTTTSEGIHFKTASTNVSITGFNIQHYLYGIHLFRYSNYSIYNNYISNITLLNGIGLFVQRNEYPANANEFANIYSNTIYLPNSNTNHVDGLYIDQSIGVNAFNNNITLNTIDGYGIDVIKTGLPITSLINISNNRIYVYGNTNGIVFGEMINNSLIQGNYIEGNLNRSGIAVQNGNYIIVDSNIVNNTLASSITGDCLQITNTNNSNFTNNKFINCDRSVFRPTFSVNDNYWNNTIVNSLWSDYFGSVSSSNLLNNVYSKNYEYTFLQSNPINLTVNETTSLYYLINYSGSGLINLNYPYRKDLKVINSSITLNPIGSNYSIMNLSSGQGVSNMQNIANGTLNVGSGESYTVGISSASGGCDYPLFTGTTISANTYQRICLGNYQINYTAFTINGNNITLDCQNAIITGNQTINLNGISCSNKDTLTIKNCNISNFYRDVIQIGCTNISIYNNYFSNATNAGIFGGSANIFNNTFFGFSQNRAIYAYNSNYSIVNNNLFIGNNYTNWAIEIPALYYSNNWSIINNIINGMNGIYIYGITNSNPIQNFTILNNQFISAKSAGIDIESISSPLFAIINNNQFNNGASSIYTINVSNINFNNNTLYNMTFTSTSVQFSKNSHTINFTNNIVNLDDTGIVILNGSDINLISNTVLNSITNRDSYASAIRLESNSSFINISNNNIWNYGGIGVLVRQSKSIIIGNNNFKQMSLTDKITQGILDGYEPTTAIGIMEIYRGYVGDGTELYTDTITKISGYASSNVTISGNTFDSNVQTYLRLQGAKNITHDISNYWYYKAQFPVYLVDADEFFNNNNYLQLTETNRGKTIDTIFVKTWDHSGIPYGLFFEWSLMNYSISKTSQWYLNVNRTTSYNLSLFNLSSNNDVFLSNQSSPISSDQPNVNVTMGPNNRTIVLSYGSWDYVSSIDTTVSNVQYSEGTRALYFTVSGSGNVALQNLSSQVGVPYYVYLNNAYQGQFYSDSYNITAGNWYFSYTRPTFNNDQPSNQNEFALMILVGVIIVFGIVYSIMNGRVDLIVAFLAAFIVLLFLKAVLGV